MRIRKESLSYEAAGKLPARGQPKTSLVPYALSLSFKRKIRHARSARESRSRPALEQAWHAHPLGQILIVTAGTGWVQEWGGQKEEIQEGDVVRIPPGQKHWHGATATTSMTHIAIQERLDGKTVEWMEQVSDEQYRK
jgi:mannose-6-phosphate isomerase-like protein (cupin superfamily)